ncbi:MAG: hypothetical protein JXE06_02800 [Coriobacteriia bacterium]|nr:hypothetical protein [Coriobacteriia bacterium]
MSEEITPARSVLRWCRVFEDEVRAGSVGLLEVVEVALSDLETEITLCPQCVTWPVRDERKQNARGFCKRCVLEHLSEATRERVAVLEAKREYAQLRKAAQRLRDEIDPDRARRPGPGSREYGRPVYPTDAPIMRSCTTCGQPFSPHDDGEVCPECIERAERRRIAREERDNGTPS